MYLLLKRDLILVKVVLFPVQIQNFRFCIDIRELGAQVVHTILNYIRYLYKVYTVVDLCKEGKRN